LAFIKVEENMKQYQFENKDLEKFQKALSEIKEPVRIITRINRNRNGYILTIEGNQSDIELYIENLEAVGISLN
jgi:hypothetical protein